MADFRCVPPCPSRDDDNNDGDNDDEYTNLHFCFLLFLFYNSLDFPSPSPSPSPSLTFDVESLSQATSEEVNSLWAGLGYYRRAQSLLKGAQLVMGVTTPDGDEDGKGGQSMDVDASITTTTADAVTNKKVKAKGKTKSKNSKKIPPSFNNTFPTTLAGLLSLPGVGPYTAGAISSIAYGNRHSIVDGNVIRVLARLRTLHKHHGFLLNNGNKKLETLCWSLADSLVNDVSVPQSFNQGLMELGATICKPSNPDCSKCPIQNVCYARRLMVLPQRIMDQDTTNMIIENEIDNESKCLEESNVVTRPYIDGQPIDPAMFPFKEEKKKIRELVFSVAVLWKDGDGDGDGDAKEASLHHRQYLFVKRPSTGLLASQWEFPTVLLYEVPVEAQKAEAEAEAGSGAGKGELNDVDVTKVDKPLEEMVSPTSVSTSTVLWKPFPSYFSSHLGIQGSDALSPGSESPLEEDKKKHLKVFKPISHTFSHQKHYMHVIAQRITFNEAKLLQFDDNNNNTVSWFTASEIEKQGITSGCKKVLQTVMKPSKEKRVASGSASGGGKEGKPKKMKTEAQIEKEKEKEKKKLEKERKQAEKEKEEKKTAPITNFFSKK